METEQILELISTDILTEFNRQEELWGTSRHWPLVGKLSATGGDIDEARETYALLAKQMQELNDNATDETQDWACILLEEIFEALAETDPEKQIVELTQCGAVITSTLKDLHEQS